MHTCHARGSESERSNDARIDAGFTFSLLTSCCRGPLRPMLSSALKLVCLLASLQLLPALCCPASNLVVQN